MTCVDCGSPSETIISGEDLEFDALLYDEFVTVPDLEKELFVVATIDAAATHSFLTAQNRPTDFFLTSVR